MTTSMGFASKIACRRIQYIARPERARVGLLALF